MEEVYGSQLQGLLAVLAATLDVVLSVEWLRISTYLPGLIAEAVRRERSFSIWPGFRLKLRRGLFPRLFRLYPAWGHTRISYSFLFLFSGILNKVAAFAAGEADEWESVWVVRLACLGLRIKIAKTFASHSISRFESEVTEGGKILRRLDILKKRLFCGYISSAIGLLLSLLVIVIGCLDLVPLPGPLLKLFDKLQGRGLVGESLLVSTLVVDSVYGFFFLLFAVALNEIVFLGVRLAQKQQREILFSAWREYVQQKSLVIDRANQGAQDEIHEDDTAQIRMNEMEGQIIVRSDNTFVQESEVYDEEAVERKHRLHYYTLTLLLRYDMLINVEALALLSATLVTYNTAVAHAASNQRRIAYKWLLYIIVVIFVLTFLLERLIYRSELVREIEKEEQDREPP